VLEASNDINSETEGRSAGTCTFRFSQSTHSDTHHVSARQEAPNVNTSMDHMNTSTNTPSPATSMSSVAFSPSRTGMPLSTQAVRVVTACEPSELVVLSGSNSIISMVSTQVTVPHMLVGRRQSYHSQDIETFVDPAWMSVCGSIGWL